MDETGSEDISYLISKLIRFYKGGISYHDFFNMPLARLYQFARHCKDMLKEEEREINKVKSR